MESRCALTTRISFRKIAAPGSSRGWCAFRLMCVDAKRVSDARQGQEHLTLRSRITARTHRHRPAYQRLRWLLAASIAREASFDGLMLRAGAGQCRYASQLNDVYTTSQASHLHSSAYRAECSGCENHGCSRFSAQEPLCRWPFLNIELMQFVHPF